MQDDKDFDDFDDFDDLDDISLDDDMLDDESSSSEEGFVDSEDDFSDEDFAGDAFTDDLDDDDFSELIDEEAEDEINPDLLASNKEGLLSKFSFNQIVIGITLIVGMGIFAFQVTTKKPPPPKESFRSSVNMSGVGDNIVFVDEQGEIDDFRPEEPQIQSDGSGMLNDVDALDSLEIDFEDTPMPVPISSEAESIRDENILVEKDLGNDFSEFEDEFSQAATDKAYEESIRMSSDSEDDLILPQSIELVDQYDSTESVPEEQSPITTKTESGSEITTSLPLKRDIQANEQEMVLETAPAEEVQSTEIDMNAILTKSDPMPAAEQPQEAETDTQKTVSEEQPTAQPADDLIAPLEKEVELKAEKIADLESKIELLEKNLKQMQEQKPVEKPTAADVVAKTTAAKPVPKAAPKIQWELRAAQPGKAWVAQKGRDDLQPVVVGDILSGLGRVQDIAFRDNRWVVVGSEGQIEQ